MIVDVTHNPSLIRKLAASTEATGVGLLDIEAIWLQRWPTEISGVSGEMEN